MMDGWDSDEQHALVPPAVARRLDHLATLSHYAERAGNLATAVQCDRMTTVILSEFDMTMRHEPLTVEE